MDSKYWPQLKAPKSNKCATCDEPDEYWQSERTAESKKKPMCGHCWEKSCLGLYVREGKKWEEWKKEHHPSLKAIPLV